MISDDFETEVIKMREDANAGFPYGFVNETITIFVDVSDGSDCHFAIKMKTFSQTFF